MTVPRDIEKRKILLRMYELEHSELLNMFKIMLTAAITTTFGAAIAVMTQLGLPDDSKIVISVIILIMGISAIGYLLRIFNKNFIRIRDKIKVIGEK